MVLTGRIPVPTCFLSPSYSLGTIFLDVVPHQHTQPKFCLFLPHTKQENELFQMEFQLSDN